MFFFFQTSLSVSNFAAVIKREMISSISANQEFWQAGVSCGGGGLLSALDAVVSGRCLANCAPKCPFTAMALFWSWLFHGLCSALKALRCGGTYVRWDSFFVQKRSLWSGSFVCAPFGVVAHGFGRPATTPLVQMPAREFKRGHLLQRGLGGGVGEWGVEVGEGRLSHSWDSAATRSAPRVNRCSRRTRRGEKQGRPGASSLVLPPSAAWHGENKCASDQYFPSGI